MGYSHFQIGCVFAEYDLFKPTTFIQLYTYEFSHKFDTVLYQFLETGASDRCLMYHLTPEILRFQPIPPLIIPLHSLLIKYLHQKELSI